MSEQRDPAQALKDAGEKRAEVLGLLFEEQRAMLRRMLRFRMDPRLKERIDASDVIQDAWLEIADRVDRWLEDPDMPFHLWVRFIAAQKLAQRYRFHVGAKKRSVERQVSADRSASPHASSVVMANALVSSRTTPTGRVSREELKQGVVAALDAMDPVDREIILLRNFEGLSNQEVALLLDLGATAASNRYVRALKRLTTVLQELGT